MAEYLSPGVYFEETSSGAVPIQGVSTTTTGFVGQTERGPDLISMVTSWSEYQRWYGGFVDPQKQQGYLPHAVYGFFQNGGTRAFIARLPIDGAPTSALEDDALGGAVGVQAVGAGAWGGRILVRLGLASQAAADRPWFSLRVLYYDVAPPVDDKGALLDPDVASNVFQKAFTAPAAREFYDNLSVDPAAPNAITHVVNAASHLVKVSLLDEGTKGAAAFKSFFDARTAAKDARASGAKAAAPTAPTFLDAQLKAGAVADGFQAYGDRYLGRADDVSQPDTWTGLKGLEAITDISMLCVPDQPLVDAATGGGLSDALVMQCESLRNRICILQSDEQEANAAATLRPSHDTSYGAFYYPWIGTMDPRSNRPVNVPPGGHIAGMIARTDLARGVFKAPANEVVIGPLLQDVGDQGPLSQKVTDGLQAMLNPRGVNCFRDFRSVGRGVRMWGARTMSSNGQWKYLNVRRLFVYAEQSILQGTQWVVFEPNDPYTWNRVVSSVSAFLTTLWRSGALMGATPQEAFTVTCDATTMSRDDIDNGRLICLVGLAAVKPAEFVVFRFSQFTAAAQT